MKRLLILLAWLALVLLTLKAFSQPKFDSVDCARHPRNPWCKATPVVIKSFEMKVLQYPTAIWEIVREKDNDHYTIQRSVDGFEWRDVAFISGRGTTLEPRIYTWEDHSGTTGKLYYLLKQTDYDQTEEILGIRQVYYKEDFEGFKISGNVIGYRYYDATGGISGNSGFKILRVYTTENIYTFKIAR